jgi:hypothetical protein
MLAPEHVGALLYADKKQHEFMYREALLDAERRQEVQNQDAEA